MIAIIYFDNGNQQQLDVQEKMENNILTAELSLHELQKRDSKINYIDFGVDYSSVTAGEEGYYVLPHGSTGLKDDSLCFFTPREDNQIIIEGPVMTMYGMISANRSFMAAVTGMTYDYALVVQVMGGTYSMYPRFFVHGYIYETIKVRIEILPKGSDFCSIAHAYRKYREHKGEIIPLRIRKKENKVLEKALRSPVIRIRMGWKPVPTPVKEQTLENEPPMKVACTFSDVELLMRECYAQGIRDAEFCLVGWNVKGHDGRWPQAFPVEESLGGEEGLKRVIRCAKSLGYLIDCHTNSTDAYSIAENFNKADLIQTKEGNISQNENTWSGGQMYNLCPEISKRQAEIFLPKLANFGLESLHYIDVISTVPPRACFSNDHPVTTRECVSLWLDIMRQSKKLFGGFSSEGVYDFAAPVLDFGLYVSFGDDGCIFSDKKIPLWQLVYHGYVMSNPYSYTINPGEEEWLKIIEYGGRPVLYLYSNFVNSNEERKNWFGENNLACHTENERRESVEMLVNICKEYKTVSFLQEESMEKYEEVKPGIIKVWYSNNNIVTIDYNQKTVSLDQK